MLNNKARIRQAVSILLTRDPQSTEVYLAQRNPKLRFFGGFFAFPGGTLDDTDSTIQIENLAQSDAEQASFIAAATREIFEETGILVTHGPAISENKKAALRNSLLAEELDFNQILDEIGHKVHANDFHFLAQLLTPEFAPVRYDTIFYWVEMPSGQQPVILQGELVDGAFYRAKDALGAWYDGTMPIVPPVTFMLKRIAGAGLRIGAPEITAAGESYQQGVLHQVYFTPGVQMLPLATRPLPPATHTNTFLIGEEKIYLVDPAPADPDEQQRLFDYLNTHVSGNSKLAAILLTHHHPDHVGAVAACQKRYKIPVFAHELTAQNLPEIQFSRFLKTGDVLDLGLAPDGKPGWELSVYHTPGHASGHLAFKEDRYGAVIAGDLVSTLSTIVINPPDGDLADYMRSLALLEQISEGALYPSHGPAVRNGAEVVRYFIRHRQEREQKLVAALGTEPKSIQELVAIIYNDVDQAAWPMAERSLEAGLLKLIKEGVCKNADSGFVAT